MRRIARAALSRAFTAWSANHPYIKFIDKSAECDAANSTWDELSTSCPGVELLIDTTTEDAKQNRTNEAVAHIEYTSARGVPRSPNGQEHTSTRTADGQTEITDFARIKFSARPCWYLDTTFCASFHAAEVGGGEVRLGDRERRRVDVGAHERQLLRLRLRAAAAAAAGRRRRRVGERHLDQLHARAAERVVHDRARRQRACQPHHRRGERRVRARVVRGRLVREPRVWHQPWAQLD